jgi:hypothetical protein
MADIKLPLKFNVNAEEIAKQFKGLEQVVQEQIKIGVEALALSTHAHILEQAADKLKSTATKYRDAVNYTKVNDNVHVITLDDSMLYREEGLEPHSMIEAFLNSPKAKTGKNGKYFCVPFEHGGGKSLNTEKSFGFSQQIQKELKRAKIPYMKIENGADGKPLLGKIHSLNIPSPKPSAAATHDIFWGIRIYQTKVKKEDIEASKYKFIKGVVKGDVMRQIMTFRIVKAEHEGKKWKHPGVKGAHLFSEALSWAEREFETKILPEILNKFKK